MEIDIGNAFKHPAVTYIAGLVIGAGLGWALHDLLRGGPLVAAGQAACVDCAQRDIAERRQQAHEVLEQVSANMGVPIRSDPIVTEDMRRRVDELHAEAGDDGP